VLVSARPITFRPVAAGHYVNDETGVEIVRLDARRWTVRVPERGGTRVAFTTLTLVDAEHWAGQLSVSKMRAVIAAAYDEAVTR
jgi:hypothetical protein